MIFECIIIYRATVLKVKILVTLDAEVVEALDKRRVERLVPTSAYLNDLLRRDLRIMP